jgi:AcrR family transcriptional regulator
MSENVVVKEAVGTAPAETPNAPGSRRRPGRREELSAAALEVIRVVGPGASMHEMAAKAGITKPVLYRYFGDREGLIASVAERFSEVLISRLMQALSGAPGESAEGLIKSGIECYIAFIEEDPELYGFLTHQAPLGSPAMVAVIDRIAGSIELVIRDILDVNGLDARPAATWAHGIVGMVHLTGARWAREPDVTREQLVSDLVTLVARGVIGAATSAPLATRSPRGSSSEVGYQGISTLSEVLESS